MKKEEWINGILESASNIKEAEPNPFLYNKVLNRLNQSENYSAHTANYRLRWALAFSIVIVFNISAIILYKSKSYKQKEAATIEALTDELSSSTTYNY